MTRRTQRAIDRLVKIAEETEGKQKAAELREALEKRSERDSSKQQEKPAALPVVTSSSRTARSPVK